MDEGAESEESVEEESEVESEESVEEESEVLEDTMEESWLLIESRRRFAFFMYSAVRDK